MSLKEISKQIQELKLLAESSPGENPANYTTKLGKINRAKFDLEQKFLDYRKAVGENSVLIITTGDLNQEFTDIAKKECGCFSANLEDIYEALTEAIPVESYRNRAAGPLIFDTMNVNMDLIGEKIGLAGIPYMHFTNKSNMILKERADLVTMAKYAVSEIADGAILPIFYAIDTVSAETIKAGYVGSNVPIILHTNDLALAERTFAAAKNIAKNAYLVSVGKSDKEITKLSTFKLKTATSETVEKTLAAIAETIRG
jgi:hypothetical protein